MTTLICILFILVSFVIFLPANYFSNLYLNNFKLNPKLFYVAFGILLILITGFRGDSVDRDYSNYIKRFNLSKESWSLVIEPTFILTSHFVKAFFNSNVTLLFVIYAMLGISTKLYAIDQLSEFWALSIIIYLSYLFTIQDLTQIRAGVAAGFIMLTIKPLYDRKILKFFFFTIMAILFHYSAVIALFFWFLNPKKIDKYLFLLLIPISYAIYYFSFFDSALLNKVLFISQLHNKFLAYQHENNSVINIYNSWQLMRIMLGVIFLWKIELITKNNKYGIILTKLYIISTCFYVLLAFNPIFASRVGDLLVISDIILIPCILYLVTPKVVAKLIVISVGLSYLFLNLFYNKILF